MGARVKAALIGISGYGDIYLEGLLDDPRNAAMDLVGVADPNPQRSVHLAELQKREIPVFDSMEELLHRRAVELVMISTPIHLHAAQTCAALDAGCHVLCEKPLASTVADIARMVQAERHSTGRVGIGYQWSFSDAIQTLKRDILGGALGRARRMRTMVSFPRGDSYFTRNDWVGRIRNLAGADVLDSPVNNATAHYLHNMLYLLGSQRHTAAHPLTVQAELYRANPIENYDTAMLRCCTEDGVEILFYTTHAMPQRFGPRCVFEFDNAVVTYDFLQAAQFVAEFKDGTRRVYGDPNADRHHKVWQMVDSVRTGAQPACGALAAAPHALCTIAAQRSPAGGIASFPDRLLYRSAIEGGSMTAVQGLDDVMHTCFQRGILPGEMGSITWAVPALVMGVPSISKVTAGPLGVSVKTRTAPINPATV